MKKIFISLPFFTPEDLEVCIQVENNLRDLGYEPISMRTHEVQSMEFGISKIRIITNYVASTIKDCDGFLYNPNIKNRDFGGVFELRLAQLAGVPLIFTEVPLMESLGTSLFLLNSQMINADSGSKVVLANKIIEEKYDEIQSDSIVIKGCILGWKDFCGTN